jgi:hypothetical protein
MTVQVAGNTTILNPSGGVLANVANVTTRTNTINFTNASSSVYAYVGVFPTYAQAAAMDHPSIGTDAGGVIIVPNGSIVVAGNWNQSPSQSTVYVAAITATGTTQVFATPVNPGSN